MMELHSLSHSRLSNMEFIQFLLDTLADCTNTKVAVVEENAPMKRYADTIKTNLLPFETATKNPLKDIIRSILTGKDTTRDRAFRSFGRQLSTFEWSENPEEVEAYQSLITLWDTHKDTPDKNVKDQSGATHNFLNDLEKEPYKSNLATLKMEPHRDRVRRTNDDYIATADNKRAALAVQGITDTKEMRNNLSNIYRDMSEYILAMAKAYPEVTEWATLLTAINVTRKRYAELITRKLAAKADKETTQEE